MSSYRAWATRFVADLEGKIALYERIGLNGVGVAVILSCLRDVVARHRTALAAPIAAADVVTEIRAPAAVVATGPRRDPLAGTWRDQMLSSATLIRGQGDEPAARRYEQHAASANPDGSRPDDDTPIVRVDEGAQARLAAIVPFTAGVQMGLFG